MIQIQTSRRRVRRTLEAQALCSCYHLLEFLESTARAINPLAVELRAVIRAHKQAVKRGSLKGAK